MPKPNTTAPATHPGTQQPANVNPLTKHLPAAQIPEVHIPLHTHHAALAEHHVTMLNHAITLVEKQDITVPLVSATTYALKTLAKLNNNGEIR